MNNNIKADYNLDFICIECFNTKTMHMTNDMIRPKKFDHTICYCYKCNKKTQHMCVGSVDAVKKELSLLKQRTCRQENAFELVKKSKTRIY